MKCRILALTCIISVLNVNAEQVELSLQGCRDLAMERNKQAQIDKENVAAAADLRKAAVAKFFPKVSANGGYMWTEKNLFILPDNYTFDFGTMNADGTFTFNDNAFQTKHFNYADFRAAFPELDQQLSEWAANEYTEVRELSELDIHHVFVGQVGITQPIFLGGKITELYRLAKSTEHIANIKAEQNTDGLIINVDEAYWRVISVEQKYLLADRYCSMLRKVEQNLTDAVEEGTATQGDLLKVRVKLNEAEVSLAKAENGLKLSKMALCQLIGLPLDSDIKLDDSGLENISLAADYTPDMDGIWQRRAEIQMLDEVNKMAHAGVRLTASGLMPNIVATAQYVTTNPNLFNGYRDNHHFDGTFQAGVVVNIPIAHADDIYQLRAAKHKAHTVELQIEEAKEKIELQATQSSQQLQEANRKLTMAMANIQNAERNLEMAQAAFDEGMLTSTELLGAQTAWLKAYSEKIDAAIDVRLYEVYLKKNIGKL